MTVILSFPRHFMQPPHEFYKKVVLKHFAIFIEPLFNKVAGLHGYNFIKKKLECRFFPVNIAKFLRTPILNNICQRLLFYMGQLLVILKLVISRNFTMILGSFIKRQTSGTSNDNK